MSDYVDCNGAVVDLDEGTEPVTRVVPLESGSSPAPRVCTICGVSAGEHSLSLCPACWARELYDLEVGDVVVVDDVRLGTVGEFSRLPDIGLLASVTLREPHEIVQRKPGDLVFFARQEADVSATEEYYD